MTDLDLGFVLGVFTTLVAVGFLTLIRAGIRSAIRNRAHQAMPPCETPCYYTHYLWHKKND